MFRVKRGKLRRGTGWAVLGTVCAVGCASLARIAVRGAGCACGLPRDLRSVRGPGGHAGDPGGGAAGSERGRTDRGAERKTEPIVPPLKANLRSTPGLKVVAIRYVGVDFDKSDKLSQELTQKTGEAFDPEKVRQTTRRLFATGRYRDIGVRAERSADGVVLIFEGVARYYVGRIQINGVKDDRLTSLLEYGTKLNPGTAFTNAEVTAGTESVKQVLAQAGYYEPVILVQTDRDTAGQQVNVTYTVDVGPQARVGKVTLIGEDLGISEKDFLKKGS